MSRLVTFLFSTPGTVVALCAAAAWIGLRSRSTAARTFAAIAGCYLAASIYAIPYAAARLLAGPYHRFEPADVPAGRVALVVFGAGGEVIDGWKGHVTVPNAVAAARGLEARRVYAVARPQWIISSGGHPSPEDVGEPSSENMRDLLVALGVPSERIVLESSSRDTHENAVRSAEIARTLGATAVVLVTSAVHMRRSIGAMRAAGWNPTPAVAPDPWFDVSWPNWLTPSNHGLAFSGELVHELFGVPYYRVRGWSR